MNTKNKLHNKVALVTGGSRGIGKAICQKLANHGALTLIHYGKNKNLADSLKAEINQEGGVAETIQADLNSIAGVSELMQKLSVILTKNNLHGIDILVNNAGIGCICPIEEMNEEKFDQLLNINVKAPFFITQRILNLINNGGRIINVSSVVTRMAIPSVGAYSMTKGAIDAMTLFLAKQLGDRQIAVNSVAPGIINTDMNADGLANADAKKYMESLSTFGRVGEPQDVADVVAFLASDESRWISGQRIEVSGGTFLG